MAKFPVIALSMCLFGLMTAPSVWAGEYKAATVRDDAIVHREPNLESESLARYPSGSKLRVYTPDRNGWYAIYFATPVKGAKFGWIRANAVDVQAGAAPTSSTGKTASRQNWTGGKKMEKYWLLLRGGAIMAGPSDLQTNIGTTPKSVTTLSASGEFDLRTGKNMFLGGRLGWYSLSAAPAAASTSADKYYASGLLFTAHLGFFLSNSPGFQLALAAGAGMGLNSAGNQTTLQGSVTTSNISSFPVMGYLTGQKALGDSVFGVFELGYLMHSLKAVPVYFKPTDANATPSNFNLSGVYANVGVGFYL